MRFGITTICVRLFFYLLGGFRLGFSGQLLHGQVASSCISFVPCPYHLLYTFIVCFRERVGILLGLGWNKIGDGLVVLRDEISILCINLHTVFLFPIPQILLFKHSF